MRRLPLKPPPCSFEPALLFTSSRCFDCVREPSVFLHVTLETRASKQKGKREWRTDDSVREVQTWERPEKPKLSAHSLRLGVFHRDERNTVDFSWTWSRAAHKQRIGEFTALVIYATTAMEEGTEKAVIWNRDILGGLIECSSYCQIKVSTLVHVVATLQLCHFKKKKMPEFCLLR